MASSAPFGIVLPSRPVLVEPQVVSPTQFAFTFPSAPRFSHIVVFLLPGFTMPEGTLAGVYVQLPGAEFRLLGAIGTDKQSAIFRVKGSETSIGNSAREDTMTDLDGSAATIGEQPVDAPCTVGISIEPAATLSQQLQSLKAPQATTGPIPNSAALPMSTKVLAQRIIKNAFNFLASFAGSAGPGGVEVVPLKSFQDWWTKFERRIENDPGFLERDDG